MKPFPRFRSAMKWIGAAAFVGVVSVWIASVWYHSFWCRANGYSVVVWGGRPIVAWPLVSGGATGPEGWWIVRTPITLEWTYQRWSDSSSSIIAIPIWPVALSAVIVTVAGWRLDTLARRRARVGSCPKCGYDLTGLPGDAVCPECNAAQPGSRAKSRA